MYVHQAGCQFPKNYIHTSGHDATGGRSLGQGRLLDCDSDFAKMTAPFLVMERLD
jgi:hypothetical protein